MSSIVLMVAEKPSIATSIAKALDTGDLVQSGKTPPIFEFSGTFKGQSVRYRVTSVVGHVFSTDFPPQYQQWDAVEPVELFTAPVVRTAEKGGIVRHLESCARGVSALVLWLDCDREGENICFEVISCCEKYMNITGKGQKIFRAKFSAVTPKDITLALSTLGVPDKNLSDAVEARQELDLKVGVAFSRYQTRYFQGKYGDLDSAVISYGPCQTPTLGFCVDRADEISSFRSEQFWTVQVAIDANSNNSSGGRPIELDWSRGRLFDQSVVDMFVSMIGEDGGYLVCQEVKSYESKRPRPNPMNTVELLKIASKAMGIGPQAAMRAAEQLYLSGYISYPRTESTSYPSSFNIREHLQLLRNGSSEFSEYASMLLTKGYSQPRQGTDAGDHPPITPCGIAHGLYGDTERIYDLVVRHFLASVSSDALFLTTKLLFCGIQSHELFTVTAKKEIDPGFLLIYIRQRGKQTKSTAEDGGDNEDEDGLEQDLPVVTEGQRCRITVLKSRTGHTTAPGYLTESELIGMMEKHQIGTDASIPTHINNICVRNYVALGSGRTLIPTALGVVLVHGYLRIDPALVLPDVRAAIEQFCNQIAKGEASKDMVIAHSLINFEQKFRYFMTNIERMDSLFEASFSPMAATGKFLSKCGKCLRYMRYIPLKPQRLYCQSCEETYNLPQNGTIKLYKEIRCPIDDFELVLFSLGNAVNAQGKSYPLCPYCYNHPPQFGHTNSTVENYEGTAESTNKDNASGNSTKRNEILDRMGCNSCLHPSCKQSATNTGMCPCPGVDDSTHQPCKGTLILDINSKPHWKLACNRCNTLIKFHADIHDITIKKRNEDNCPHCGYRTATFEFNKLKLPSFLTKLNASSSSAGGGVASTNPPVTSYTGCLICDDCLNGMTELIAGRSMNLQVLRQLQHKRGAGGRGRGRGRGRGDRSKGKDVKMSFSDF